MWLQRFCVSFRDSGLLDLAISIADDNATNRLILDRFPKNACAALDFVESGEAALAAAGQTRYNGNLMDGLTATRAAEQRAGAAPTTVTGVTASVFSHQVLDYRAAGMDDVLPMPVVKRDLLRRVVGLFRSWHPLGFELEDALVGRARFACAPSSSETAGGFRSVIPA